jgi:hypothetical protein
MAWISSPYHEASFTAAVLLRGKNNKKTAFLKKNESFIER